MSTINILLFFHFEKKMRVDAKDGYNIRIHTHSHQFLSIMIQLHDENLENTPNPHFNLKLDVVFFNVNGT